MRCRCFFFGVLLLGLQLGHALGQAGAARGGSAIAGSQPAAVVSNVAPDAPVITIEGLCDDGLLAGLMVESTAGGAAQDNRGCRKTRSAESVIFCFVGGQQRLQDRHHPCPMGKILGCRATAGRAPASRPGARQSRLVKEVFRIVVIRSQGP